MAMRVASEAVIWKGLTLPSDNDPTDPVLGPTVGDIWVDTTANLVKRLVSNLPDVWVSIEGGGTNVNFADAEVPSGLINGSNAAYTLVTAPSPALSLELFKNGVLQQQGNGKDYTLASATITMAVAPVSGDVLLAWYRH